MGYSDEQPEPKICYWHTVGNMLQYGLSNSSALRPARRTACRARLKLQPSPLVLDLLHYDHGSIS